MRVAVGMGRPLVDVMIPEGLTRFEVAARLEHWSICEASAFLEATASAELMRTLEVPASTAEGYLFPDTYELQVGQAPEEIVRRMVARWRARGANLVRTYEFPNELHLLHDIVDPGHAGQRINVVYPKLLELVADR